MSLHECETSAPIEPQEASPMEKTLHVVGIDMAKQVLPLVGRDEHGTMLRQRLDRAPVMACIAPLPPMRMGMAACGGRMTGRAACASLGTRASSWRLHASNPTSSPTKMICATPQGLGTFFVRYNEWRQHQALDYRTPAAVYFDSSV
jgi:hypothetical protein